MKKRGKNYWLKGGIIGLVISVLYFIMMVSLGFCTDCCMTLLCRIERFFTPINILYNKDLFTFLSFIIIGALIGLIIEKIRR